jgi:Raf kinase inhibitor-like YbhB/YbcL family protein
MFWSLVCLLIMVPWVVQVSAAEAKKVGELAVSSPAFVQRGAIPAKYTCDGADVSPPLLIGNVPAATGSIALIVDDPDAPGTWVHWLVWNVDPRVREIGEGKAPAGGTEGRNDWGRNSYGGPCPPSGAHRYFFRLYALDASVKLAPSSTRTDLERAMAGHVLAHGQLTGIYKRR